MLEPDVADATALRYAVQRLSRRLRRQAQYGLTVTQISTLTTVERHGSIPMARLRDAEQTSKSALTRVVARLEHDRLIERQIDPDDRRGFVISITNQGREILAEATNRQDLYLLRQLEALDGDDRAKLLDAVEAIENLLRARA
ncbi:conserved hypothetical protein [metagenome]|uniref:HTH marR-type domain-containing protein n=1 Tax=metagenome TaxID=256318 RepID=A0A2P2C911_9ZZZZ